MPFNVSTKRTVILISLASFRDTTLQEKSDVKVPAHFPGVKLGAFPAKSGLQGDNPQILVAGQFVGYFFGQAIGKKLLLPVTRQVEQGQDGHGGPWG
jgi:hypothetical protein